MHVAHRRYLSISAWRDVAAPLFTLAVGRRRGGWRECRAAHYTPCCDPDVRFGSLRGVFGTKHAQSSEERETTV